MHCPSSRTSIITCLSQSSLELWWVLFCYRFIFVLSWKAVLIYYRNNTSYFFVNVRGFQTGRRVQVLPFNLTFSGHIHGCERPECWNITAGIMWDCLSLKSWCSLPIPLPAPQINPTNQPNQDQQKHTTKIPKANQT